MENVLPELIQISGVAPLLLRLMVAGWLFYVSYLLLRRKKISFEAFFEAQQFPLHRFVTLLFSIVTLLTGFFFFFGFFAQIASFITLCVIFNLIYIENREESILDFSPWFYITMIVISVSLLFSGAGYWSIDIS